VIFAPADLLHMLFIYAEMDTTIFHD
jgi:hypothetical protein